GFCFGDADALLDEVEEFVTGTRSGPEPDRAVARVRVTGVVGATDEVAAMGDRRWSELLATHDDLTRAQLERFGGREVRTTGDGFLGTFDRPGRAVRCACAIRDAVHAIGIQVRVGLHSGEIELHDDDIGGIAVHIAQRVQPQAEPNEGLVSRTPPALPPRTATRMAALRARPPDRCPHPTSPHAPAPHAAPASDTPTDSGTTSQPISPPPAPGPPSRAAFGSPHPATSRRPARRLSVTG